MNINTLKKQRAAIARQQAKVQETEATILKSLPEALGFSGVRELAEALLKMADRPGKSHFVADSFVTTMEEPKRAPRSRRRRSSKRTRVKITDDIRQKTIQLLKRGGSGAEVAKAAGISIASVANIKRAAGLVKKAA